MVQENYSVVINRCKTTKEIIEESWYLNGLRHAVDRPAHIVFKDGKLKSVGYYDRNHLSRLDGKPAYVEMHPETGVVILEKYCEGGWYNREDGPAIIDRGKEGNVINEQYFLDDTEYSKEEWEEIMSHAGCGDDLDQPDGPD